MAESTVLGHHGNPFDMQLPYLLPLSEHYSTVYFVLKINAYVYYLILM